MDVAVKALRLGGVSTEAMRPLLRELRAACAAAQACNTVCPLLGVTLAVGGDPALVLQLYECSALDLMEQEHPEGAPPPLALAVLEAVARALLALHTAVASGAPGQRRRRLIQYSWHRQVPPEAG